MIACLIMDVHPSSLTGPCFMDSHAGCRPLHVSIPATGLSKIIEQFFASLDSCVWFPSPHATPVSLLVSKNTTRRRIRLTRIPSYVSEGLAIPYEFGPSISRPDPWSRAMALQTW